MCSLVLSALTTCPLLSNYAGAGADGSLVSSVLAVLMLPLLVTIVCLLVRRCLPSDDPAGRPGTHTRNTRSGPAAQRPDNNRTSASDLLVLSAEGRVLWAGHRVASRFGLTCPAMEGCLLSSLPDIDLAVDTSRWIDFLKGRKSRVAVVRRKGDDRQRMILKRADPRKRRQSVSRVYEVPCEIVDESVPVRNLIEPFRHDHHELDRTIDHYRRIVEYSLDGMAILDEDGRIREVNRSFRRLTLYSQDELEGVEFVRLLDHDGVARWRQLQEVMERADSVNSQLDLVSRDGRYVPVKLRLVSMGDQGRGLLCLVSDVTGESLVRRALEEREKKYRQIVEHSAGLIVRTDADGRISFCNTFAERLLGLRPGRLLGRQLGDLVSNASPSHRQTLLNTFARAVRSGARTACEVPMLDVHGNPHWINWTMQPCAEDDSTDVLCLGSDITELIRTRRQLEQIRRRLEQTVSRRTVELERSNVKLRDEIRLHEQARRQLKQTSRSMSALLSNLPGMAYRCVNDESMTIEYVSDGAEDLTGYDARDILERGICFRDLIVEDDYRRIKREVDEAVARSEPFALEYRIRRRDGQVAWVMERGVEVRHESSGASTLEGFIFDVTDFRQAKQELDRTEKRYHFLADHMLDMVSRHDPEGTYLYASPACTRLLGYRGDELVGRSAYDFFHPDDQTRIRADHDSVLNDDVTNDLEYRALHKDGHWVWLSTNSRAVRDPSTGQVREIIAVTRDITARKQSELELAESELRYRTVVESSANGIGIINRDGTVEFVNRRVADWLGLDADRVVGCPIEEVLPGPLGMSIKTRMNDSLNKGEPYTVEECIEKDGQTMHFLTRGTPLCDRDGTCRRILFVSTDLTDMVNARHEKQQIEEQFRQAQKMEAIGRLAGGIAHDFNNQLTLIKGYARILQKKMPDEPMLKEPLEVIARAAERSAMMTNQLLSFGRKQVLSPEIVQVNDLLEEMKKPLARMIGEDIDLSLDLHDSLPTVEVDPVQVHQALMNLVVNARDAMPGGGRLVLSTETRVVAPGELDVVDNAGGTFVDLSVHDTGTGMDADTREHIFEPFYTTKARGEGTGLGLAMVWGFARQAGGTVQVDSTPGEGTTFRILLPASAQAVTEAEDETDDAPCHGCGTILVVEDEGDVRNLVNDVLSECGYTVLVANGAEQARALVRRHDGQLDMIITDVVMPGLNGPELVQHLSKGKDTVPVLYMTGYADEAIVRSGLSGDGVNLINKPFDPDYLARRVDEILQED